MASNRPILRNSHLSLQYHSSACGVSLPGCASSGLQCKFGRVMYCDDTAKNNHMLDNPNMFSRPLLVACDNVSESRGFLFVHACAANNHRSQKCAPVVPNPTT